MHEEWIGLGGVGGEYAVEVERVGVDCGFGGERCCGDGAYWLKRQGQEEKTEFDLLGQAPICICRGMQQKEYHPELQA